MNLKTLNRVKFYFSSAGYVFKTIVLRKEIPFIGGIAINDACNLRCSYCSVSNRKLPDLSFKEIEFGLKELHKKGIRYLYIEGGEPFLWKENGKTLEDIIVLARKTGFYFIVVYTNGTFPINTSADTVFVSLDGTEAINDSIRDVSYRKIISNINTSANRKIFINCTITARNKDYLSQFCKEMSTVKNIHGIFFYFYSPVKQNDELTLSFETKNDIIEEILTLKKVGIRILNSKTGLKSYLKNNWNKPNNLSYLFAENKLYKCCRFVGNNGICNECGYLGFVEIYHITRLHPDAVCTAFNYL